MPGKGFPSGPRNGSNALRDTGFEEESASAEKGEWRRDLRVAIRDGVLGGMPRKLSKTKVRATSLKSFKSNHRQEQLTKGVQDYFELVFVLAKSNKTVSHWWSNHN
jgi:hypothetical protein